ncbi:unnamed protein product [Effrenium voratum]|nr:unnamed protein product [Effrenium voratum]
MRGILLYALGIPAALVALIHALFKEDSADSHRAFGYLLDGSSADFFYIQLVIILLMASSLVFGNYLTLGTLFRVVWLLGVYSSYSLVISAIKPFDARDKNVLLRLELTSDLASRTSAGENISGRAEIGWVSGVLCKVGILPL